MTLEVRPLTRDELAEKVAHFINIATDVPGEYWTAEHFLVDRPGKWTLSSAAWQAGVLVGYAIVSERGPSHAHLHHFMVATAARGSGVGARLAHFMMELAKTQGYQRLTLKVATDNVGAQRFYRRIGFTAGERDGRLLWFSCNLAA
jgi:ribosomal protein S18 acetylase RimI-like enzyme